jgi:hypothetical protein
MELFRRVLHVGTLKQAFMVSLLNHEGFGAGGRATLHGSTSSP